MGPTTCTSPPCPLVMVFHGWTMTGQMMQGATQMDTAVSAAGRGGAVVVYPDGTGSGAASCWRVQGAMPLGGCGDTTIYDVGYVAALIDLMILRYSVDLDRVYSVGFSNGGTMNMQLACFLNWNIAAFGFGGPGGLMDDNGAARFVDAWHCPHPERRLSHARVPILHVHGVADPMAWYSPNVVPTAQWFAAQQGMSEGGRTSCAANGWACERRTWSSPVSPASYVLESVTLGIHVWDMFSMLNQHSGGSATGFAYPTTERMLTFMWNFRLSQLCPGGGCGPPPPPPPPGCRSDLCGDIANDCCAPGTEARSCRATGTRWSLAAPRRTRRASPPSE
jgi:pimeloyl-ACP methyl ester carboxylesterase